MKKHLLAHEFMYVHIRIHADSFVYLIILHILPCRPTIIEYMIPKDGLCRK